MNPDWLISAFEPGDRADAFVDEVRRSIEEYRSAVNVISKLYDAPETVATQRRRRRQLMKACRNLQESLDDNSLSALLDLPEPARSAQGLINKVLARGTVLTSWKGVLAAISLSATSDGWKPIRRDSLRASKEVALDVAHLWRMSFDQEPTAYQDAYKGNSKFVRVLRDVLEELGLQTPDAKTLRKVLREGIDGPLLPLILSDNHG